MTPRQIASRERLYRTMSVSLALVTAVLLVPASWITMPPPERETLEPEARAIEIVRLPPDTLPPPPPLPPRPEPRREAKPEPEPESRPDPEPVTEPLRLHAKVPEIDIPEERQRPRAKNELANDVREQIRFRADAPRVEVPEERREVLRRPALDAQPERRVERRVEDVDVSVPRAVPRKKQSSEVDVAAMTKQTYHDAEAPDVDVATPRPRTRQAPTPSRLPPSRQLKTGVAVERAENAPAVEVPRGNTSKPQRAAPVAVSGAYEGSRVTYDSDPGDAAETAVPSPRPPAASGEAPRIAVTEGGTSGLKYSAAAADTSRGGRARTTAGPGSLDAVRAALSRKYGLPLVSVNDMGQRSTEAARWNVLLPQLSELLRDTRGLASWEAGDEGGLSVERDGKSLIIRYPDGVVHVLVPSEEGLAMLFVARGDGARPVVSKVQEAESARKALRRYTRGAS
jgi:hypothetical protein